MNDGPVLVLDEGTSIPSNAIEMLNLELLLMQSPWDIISIGYRHGQCLRSSRMLAQSTNHFCQARFVAGSYAYLVYNANAATNLIRFENQKEPEMLEHIW